MPDYSRVGAGHLATLMHRALRRGDAAALAALRAECARRQRRTRRRAGGSGSGNARTAATPLVDLRVDVRALPAHTRLALKNSVHSSVGKLVDDSVITWHIAWPHKRL